MIKISRILLLLFTCIFILSPLLTYSQSKETGAIQGIVSGEDAYLPGVKVTISSPRLIGGEQSTVTNAEGKYRFPALPPGTYTLLAQLEGFTSAKKTGVRLKIGITLTVDLTMELGRITETIEVKGIPALIDIKDSQTGTTHMSIEFLKHVPSGRSIRGQLSFAPGVTGESTYGSSTSLSNNFRIDGVKINSPEYGEAEVGLDYDSIEEISVMGLGAPAEYGGFTGAVVSAVTKSGGNKFSGMFGGFMQLPKWHSDNVPEGSELERFEGNDEEYDAHLNLGGPITKDKLWFYTSARYGYFKESWEEYDGPVMYEPAIRLMGKLTWQADKNNRLQAALEWNQSRLHNIEAGPWLDESALVDEWRYQYFFNANYLHLFSDFTYMEAKFGGYYQRGETDMDEETRRNGPSPHEDYETGIMSGNFIEFWDVPRERYQLNAGITHHADNFIAGSHDFKFGVEFEYAKVGNNRGYPGGRLYGDVYGEPYEMIEYAGYNANGHHERLSAYVQDTWSIGDRLTINPGIRFNYWKGSVIGLPGVFNPKSGIAPRIGITFDVFGDHSTALKAHYGKYYQGMIGMFYLHLQPQGAERLYLWGGVLNEWAEEEFDETGEWPDGYPFPEDWVLEYEDPWEQEYTVDPNLKMPHMNQYVIGIERELAQDMSIGVSFIYRSHHNLMDRVNLTGEWEAIQWTCPYEGPFEGQTFTVYEHLNPGENQYYITNPKAGEDYGQAYDNMVPFTPYQKFRGLEITFEKRYAHRWQLQASYVYGKAWGTNDNEWNEFAEGRSAAGGASTLFSNPNWTINAEGNLSIDPTHHLKITGSWLIPRIDVSLGFYYSFRTGSPFAPTIMVPEEIDPDNNSWGGPVYILAEERGSRRFPDRHTLDIRMEKLLKIGNLRLSVILDIFNALNDDTETDFQTEMDPYTDFPFMTAFGVRRPRTFRLGFRLEF